MKIKMEAIGIGCWMPADPSLSPNPNPNALETIIQIHIPINIVREIQVHEHLHLHVHEGRHKKRIPLITTMMNTSSMKVTLIMNWMILLMPMET
jgi:hypothetical protein